MTGRPPAADLVDVHILRGHPTDEELAALVTVIRAKVAAAPATSAAATAPRPSRWATYWRAAGAVPPPGTGAWRSSIR